MGFSRQKYWSGLPCPPPGDLRNPGIEPESLMSLVLAGRFFIPLVPPGKPGDRPYLTPKKGFAGYGGRKTPQTAGDLGLSCVCGSAALIGCGWGAEGRLGASE